MSVEVRPFRGSDGEQLTALVNAHIAAVVPGGSVSVARVMSQLERDPGEFIVDPWVSERTTLVAVQRERVVAAGHLLRYDDDEQVDSSYRNAAELRVPEQWPHVRAAYERAGFAPEGAGRVETVFLADVTALQPPGDPPLPGLGVSRSVGINGTRLSAQLGDEVVGYIEVETLDEAERLGRSGRIADVGNLHVVESRRRQGIGRWLVAHAGEWLRLGRVERLLDCTGPEDEAVCGPFLEAVGFRVLTRTLRSWTRAPTAV